MLAGQCDEAHISTACASPALWINKDFSPPALPIQHFSLAPNHYAIYKKKIWGFCMSNIRLSTRDIYPTLNVQICHKRRCMLVWDMAAKSHVSHVFVSSGHGLLYCRVHLSIHSIWNSTVAPRRKAWFQWKMLADYDWGCKVNVSWTTHTNTQHFYRRLMFVGWLRGALHSTLWVALEFSSSSSSSIIYLFLSRFISFLFLNKKRDTV